MTFLGHVDSKVDLAKRPEIRPQIASTSFQATQKTQKTLSELVSVQFMSTRNLVAWHSTELMNGAILGI